MAKTIELREVHSFSTSSNLCQHTTGKMWMLQIVTLRSDYQYQVAHLFVISLTDFAK